MLTLGKYSLLKILRKTDHGVYLCNEEGDEVLLPNKYVPEVYNFQDTIEVFIYKDSEDRIIATDLKPKIGLNEFAFLKVKDVSHVGAFLDWGLEKDLMAHISEQSAPMKVGHRYVVYLYLDENSERLAASAKLDRFFKKDAIELTTGQQVNILVFAKTELGFSVVINNLYKGLLFKNEIFRKVEVGDRLVAYVKKIREDNKIDVSLQKQGFENIEPNALKILELLKNNGGKLFLTDKSDPEEIMTQLEMSKKTFKKAIGILYSRHLIRIEEDGVFLVE